MIMKDKIKRMLIMGGLASVLAISFVGCTGQAAEKASDVAHANEESSQEETASLDALDLEFTKRDLDASYDEVAATKITLADSTAHVQGSGASAVGSTVTITQAGTYLVTGMLSDGQIVVEAGDEDKLQIVFAGVSIHHETGPALFVSNADKCFVTLADGTENTLSDGAAYQLTGEDDSRDATIFSKDDLTINGTGSLTVTGAYKHAVCSNDDLVITGGTFSVTSVEDAFRGKDCIKIADGAFTVNAGDDAFHSDAFFYAADGKVNVETCYEGYEGTQVIVSGGEHTINASDDALNAALPDSDTSTDADVTDTRIAPDAQGTSNMQGAPDAQGMPGMQAGPGAGGDQMAASSSECVIQINGGILTLSAQNDGIDSNGTVEITGGTVLVSGPDAGMDGALDYDMSATVSGGTLLMVGAVGNTNGLSASDQSVALVSVSGKAGQKVAFLDAEGAELASLTPQIDFGSVLVSSPQVAEGEAFSIQVNGESTESTMGTGLDMGQNGGMGPGANRGQQPQGGMKEGVPSSDDGMTAPPEKDDRGMAPQGDGTSAGRLSQGKDAQLA